ncbi:MAG: hypothetical protein ACRDJN_28270 [Chloroflexota bacterium]
MKATSAAPQCSPTINEATMAMVTSSSTFISRWNRPTTAPQVIAAPPATAPAEPRTATTSGGPPAKWSPHEARVSSAVSAAVSAAKRKCLVASASSGAAVPARAPALAWL